MPRTPRRNEPGHAYHLISRFVDRNWYIRSEEERDCYLMHLGRAVSRSDWSCLAYAVMSNHIHLCVVAGAQSLDAWVRRAHSPFADWMNRTHDRIGVVFVRGPKQISVPPASVGRVIAYIHNNPVRAKLAVAPSASTWTSHRAYLGEAPRPSWLQVSEGLARAGFQDGSQFDHWVSAPDRSPDEQELTRAVVPEVVRGSPRSAPRVDPGEVVRAAAAEIGISIEQLRSSRKSADEVTGREVAAHCASTLGITGASIACALGVSQQAVSQMRLRWDAIKMAELGARVLRRLGA